jgi:flagellar biosynthesis protein FlhF
MNIKRVIANDMTEAMAKIRAQHGPDTVILSNRAIRKKGLKGLFSKPLVEVVIAFENDAPDTGALNKKASGAAPANLKDLPKNTESQGAEAKIADTKLTEMERRLETMNVTMQEIASRLRGKVPGARYNPEIQRRFTALLENEVEEGIARAIADEAQDIADRRKADSDEAFREVVAHRLGDAEGIKLHKFQRTVAVFVGPTGAGKTTTIAKLAARFALAEKAKVALVTADAYRIAAHEQIKTYSDILELPLKIIYNPKEIGAALQELDNVDIVLIDTPGKSPKDTAHQQEILSIIENSGASEVFLVMSAATGYKSSALVADQYRFLKDYRVLMTKMDESPTIGCLLNARALTGKPLSYVTTGQSVPDDIELMDIASATQQLVGKNA